MTPRTVVQLRGGIGNQLFQYAAGRHVAERTGAPLLLDLSFISSEDHRDYALARFGVTDEAVEYDIPARAMIDDVEATAVFAEERFGATPLWELAHDFHDQLTSAPANSYLVGYWQSELNFLPVADAVRATLGPGELGPAATEIAAAIDASEQPVALQVRRGDYVNNPTITELLGPKDADYYYRAGEAIADAVVGPEYFVFSDDPEWCAETLVLPGPMTIASGGTTAEEDLALIGRCRHAAIANSTFGWWGAWLGEQPDSVIVGPKKWFGTVPLAEHDLMPPRWLRV